MRSSHVFIACTALHSVFIVQYTPATIIQIHEVCACVCVCAMCIDIYLFWVFHFVILCCLLWFGALVRFDFGMCVSWCLIPWCKLRSSTLFAYYTFYSFPFYHTISLAFFFSLAFFLYYAQSLPCKCMFDIQQKTSMLQSAKWIYVSLVESITQKHPLNI